MANNSDKDYVTLGLRPGAPFHEVRRAYLDLTKVWHPDRFNEDPRLKKKAEAQLREINCAYERLCALQPEPAVKHHTAAQQARSAGRAPQLPIVEIMTLLVLAGVLAVLAVVVLACQQLTGSPTALVPPFGGLV